MPDVTVLIPAGLAGQLAVLVDPGRGLPDLSVVVGVLLDHVQQGISRPGSWERPWLEQVFGDAWADRLPPGTGE